MEQAITVPSDPAKEKLHKLQHTPFVIISSTTSTSTKSTRQDRNVVEWEFNMCQEHKRRMYKETKTKEQLGSTIQLGAGALQGV